MTQRKRAVRFSAGSPLSCSRIKRKRVSYDASLPAKRAEYTPGAPPRASISKPESSARESSPEAFAYAIAFSSAFSVNVVPVSSTSIFNGISWRDSSLKGKSEKIARYSSNLCWLVVANNRSRIGSLLLGARRCSILQAGSCKK